jgi:hypothetical protein
MNTSCHRYNVSLFAVVLASVGALTACGGPDTIVRPGPSSDAAVSPTIMTANALVSDCGGFGAPKKSGLAKRIMSEDAPTDTAANQCAPETLTWTYDVQTQSLTFKDLHVVLNCCGEHAIQASYGATANALLVTETDSPGTGRCLCLCVFDFSIDVVSLASSPVDVTLVRDVTDSGDPKTIWSGTLDLSAGAGTIPLAIAAPAPLGCPMP